MENKSIRTKYTVAAFILAYITVVAMLAMDLVLSIIFSKSPDTYTDVIVMIKSIPLPMAVNLLTAIIGVWSGVEGTAAILKTKNIEMDKRANVPDHRLKLLFKIMISMFILMVIAYGVFFIMNSKFKVGISAEQFGINSLFISFASGALGIAFAAKANKITASSKGK